MTSTPHHVPWASFLSLAASMALVGCYVGLSKFLVLTFPIFLLAWLRFGAAAIAMVGWVRRGPAEAPLNARDRKLLLHRKEIDRLIGKSQEEGKTIIPLKLYSKHGIVKLQIAVAGRKKQYDKRREIAKKTADREIERAMKERLRR